MRAGVVIGLVVALALTGCAGGTPPARSAPVPSPGCGGFHLAVRNTGHADAAVSMNGQAVTTVPAGKRVVIAEYGEFPAPAMPWDLRVTRTTDGAVLLTAHVVKDGSDQGQVSVGDAPAAEVALSSYTC